MNAFNVLLERYQQPLFTFILNMVKEKQLAEDIFQETFIRVIKNITSYRDQGSFKSWIFQISSNLCKDHWKKKSSTEEIHTEGYEIENATGNIDFIREIESDEDIAWLRGEVDALPEKLKEVLLLHVYSDMTFKEIASQLEVSINTVLGRMHYAKLALKKRWDEYER